MIRLRGAGYPEGVRKPRASGDDPADAVMRALEQL